MNFFVTLNLFMISSCLRILFGIEYSKLIINGCCLIVFSTYIIYDTQLILGNQREKFNNNDCVLAAMCLYIDIINLFIEMIKIVAASLNENVDDKDNKDDGFELLLGLKKKYSDEEEDEKDNKKGKEKDSKKKKEKDEKEEKEDNKIIFLFVLFFILISKIFPFISLFLSTINFLFLFNMLFCFTLKSCFSFP